MLVRVCDCCGKEMKKDFISFHINWAMVDVVSGETENIKETYTLEYCEKCFSDVLERLGLETKK